MSTHEEIQYEPSRGTPQAAETLLCMDKRYKLPGMRAFLKAAASPLFYRVLLLGIGDESARDISNFDKR
jgi:hypothetical protein